MIDLTQLPSPDVIETLDYEQIYQQKLARFQFLYPDYTAVLESDPVVKLLELSAYDELTLRQRINDAAASTMLAYATGTDLDHRAADYGVSRLLISPANPDANPPVAAIYESNERLRYRCQMALEGLSVAGSRGAYLFHTLSASGNVLDAGITNPVPGTVRVCVLDARGTGVPDAALLSTVNAALSAETVRPLCDTVEVVAAASSNFTVTATLTFEPGAEAASGGIAAAEQRLAAMITARRKIGGSVPLSAIYAALQTAGVTRVTLSSPAADVNCTDAQYPQCTAITLSAAP